ncbi:hypothetical protein, partial [uncultured Duncaniella sp.]|uniref:hypothetical protein n=1 Tax=uncultured Duncaniella sp. TaxID=2768039 RepID=UPI0026313616
STVCCILDYDFETARFLTVKKERRVNAFSSCLCHGMYHGNKMARPHNPRDGFCDGVYDRKVNNIFL